jgi:RNA polymerase sigma-70 factor (ECF subfamily)
VTDSDDREQRFRRLYDENFSSIQAYAVNRVASMDDVPDIVAEVFTTAWRRLDDLPPPPADRLWLYGTARRVISRYYRSTSRLRNLVERVTAGERVHPETDPAREQLLAAIAKLRASDREALMLVYWEELSYAEAAKVLGCSVNAVGTRVHRAKNRLRETFSTESRLPAFVMNANGVTDGS